jgi:hypothetical protein
MPGPVGRAALLSCSVIKGAALDLYREKTLPVDLGAGTSSAEPPCARRTERCHLPLIAGEQP